MHRAYLAACLFLLTTFPRTQAEPNIPVAAPAGGTVGYTPKSAYQIMRNIVLTAPPEKHRRR